MFDDVIKFAPCEHDLEKKPEYWQSDTFEKRNHAVLESIKEVTGYYPTKNRQPIRVGVFQVADKTTIDELVGNTYVPGKVEDPHFDQLVKLVNSYSGKQRDVMIDLAMAVMRKTNK